MSSLIIIIVLRTQISVFFIIWLKLYLRSLSLSLCVCLEIFIVLLLDHPLSLFIPLFTQDTDRDVSAYQTVSYLSIKLHVYYQLTLS